MSLPEQEETSRSYSSPPKRKRRYSVWTLLAPAAAVILWISFFSALGQSCVFKECKDKDSGSAKAADTTDERNDLARGTKAKVKEGDTLGGIAAKFKLTEEELKACNPKVDPQAIRAGQYLTVSAVDCEDADKAAVGANPDPLAGDTTTGQSANAPEQNGTAAADPSVDAQADKNG
ncbi:MAG: LysM peptidoglycan-binding domain-containing protein [Thermoleophilia bacterium]|nr:LysM peptidoglycan-binding domain-containing protein [Thermoleophilia bacterium]